MPYLLFYALVVWALTQTFGVYDAGYTLAIAVGYLVMVAWAAVERWRENRKDWEGDAALPRLYSKVVFAALAIFGAGALALNPGIVYGQAGLWMSALRDVLGIAAAAVTACVVMIWLGREKWRRWIEVVFWLAVGLLIAARLLVLLASPSPYIDVFTLTNRASDFLRAGQNPYIQPYPDLYDGLYDYAAGPNYWPAYYVWSAVFRVAGDIRLGAVVAEAVVALVLPKILATFGLEVGLKRLATLAWLTFPVSLYVIEQAWIEPVIVMLMVLTVWCLLASYTWRWAAAGIVLGFAAALKQYLPLFVLLTLILVWRTAGRRAALQMAAWVAVTFAVILLPFLIADPKALFEQTIFNYLARGLRLDGLSIPAWLANEFRLNLDTLSLGGVYALAVGVGVWVAARWREQWSGWAGGLAVAFGGLFIFGKQAFCNYYYLLAFILLLAGCLTYTRQGDQPVAPTHNYQ